VKGRIKPMMTGKIAARHAPWVQAKLQAEPYESAASMSERGGYADNRRPKRGVYVTAKRDPYGQKPASLHKTRAPEEISIVKNAVKIDFETEQKEAA